MPPGPKPGGPPGRSTPARCILPCTSTESADSVASGAPDSTVGVAAALASAGDVFYGWAHLGTAWPFPGGAVNLGAIRSRFTLNGFPVSSGLTVSLQGRKPKSVTSSVTGP